MGKVKGSLLITAAGLETSYIPELEREKAVLDFLELKSEAECKGDRFYALSEVYENVFSYGTFYPGFMNMSWPEFHECDTLKGISQKVYQLMHSFCQCPLMTKLSDEVEFQDKEYPHAHSGYSNPQCFPDYVGNMQEWEEWHRKWYIKHQEQIDWSNSNSDWLPRVDLVMKILKRELQKKLEETNDFGKAKEIVSQMTESEIGIAFHKRVMSTKGPSLPAYAETIGKEICECNYYREETRLSSMEHQVAKSLRKVYSIINRNRQLQFISIDFKHGMFEFHNASGEHLGEFHFDGSFNSKQEADHSLKCLNQWYKQTRR